MRIFVAVLIVLLLLLQYKLWISDSSITQAHHLKQKVSIQVDQNKQLNDKNKELTAEIGDLKSQQTAVEERARKELGLVKPGERYYQVVDKQS